MIQLYLLEKTWSTSLENYNFIKSQKDRNIQSSLFSDYFIQSINVANRSNDLISCNNSVEPRNIFISKNILKIALNLPLKYKINYKEKNINFTSISVFLSFYIYVFFCFVFLESVDDFWNMYMYKKNKCFILLFCFHVFKV